MPILKNSRGKSKAVLWVWGSLLRGSHPGGSRPEGAAWGPVPARSHAAVLPGSTMGRVLACRAHPGQHPSPPPLPLRRHLQHQLRQSCATGESPRGYAHSHSPRMWPVLAAFQAGLQISVILGTSDTRAREAAMCCGWLHFRGALAVCISPLLEILEGSPLFHIFNAKKLFPSASS